MKTKKKTVTAEELLEVYNNCTPENLLSLKGRSYDINGIKGSFVELRPNTIKAEYTGHPCLSSWCIGDEEDLDYFLYMLSLKELDKNSVYVTTQKDEERLDKYFRTSKKPRKDTHKVRKTRSDKGKKRGKYLKKVEEPVEYTFNIRTPQLQVDPLPPLPPSGSVFELLEKILSVLQEINSKV